MRNACNMCNVMFPCLFYIIWMLAGINQVISFEISCNVSTSTLQIVEQCPTDEKSYKEAESRKNCTSISNACKSFEYHCVMNAWRNATVEVCAPSLYVIGEVCAEYSEYFMSIRSSERSCQNFSEPCSSRYKSTEQYKYPGCYDIANKANTTVLTSTTDLSQSFNESDAPLQNIQGLSAGATTGIILTCIAVLVVPFICFLIAFVYVRRKMIKENKSCEQVISAIPFCCQSLYEGSIMLKIQDFMDKQYYREVEVCDHGSQSTLAVMPVATSSVPLLSNQGNDENNETTDSHETQEKQIVKNDDECDVSLQINTQQQNTTFLQNQPDTSSTTTRTAQPLEPNSDVHPSIEHVTPPSTSEVQNFDSSSASPLEQNSSTSSTVDQQDTSYYTIQSEPVDPPDSSENRSLDFTSVSVLTRPLENAPYNSRNSSTVQSPVWTKVTSSLLSSTLHGSGDLETHRKKCVLTVPPEGPEASSEPVSSGQTGLQPERSTSGKRKLAVVNPQKRTKLSFSEGAEGGVLTDQMHGDNAVPSRTTRPSGFQDQRNAGSDQENLNKRFDRIEKMLQQESERSEKRYQLMVAELHAALQRIEHLEKKIAEKDTEIKQLLSLLDSRNRELEKKDAEIRDLERQLGQQKREKKRIEREKEAEERKYEKLEHDMSDLIEKHRNDNKK